MFRKIIPFLGSILEWMLSQLDRLVKAHSEGERLAFMQAFGSPQSDPTVLNEDDPALNWSAVIPAKPIRMTWETTPDGKLLLNGTYHQPKEFWAKEHLEEAIALMRNAAASSSRLISISAILIDPYVATALWNANVINTDNLDSSVNLYDGLTIVLNLGGINTWVSIVEKTYYTSYEFYIDGLPHIHRVGDVKDLKLALQYDAA